jgi:opacity protein-like surface antigen
MQTARFITSLVLAVLASSASFGTPADRLKELDHLRREGLITEEAYQKRWNEIIAEGITPEPTQARTPGVRGRTEFSFSGSWVALSAGDVDLDLLSAQLTAGFMVSNNMQLTVGGLYLHADVEGIDVSAAGGMLGANYLFAPQNQIVPYVGAGVTYVYADFDGEIDDDDWAWEVRGGFKQYVRENVAVKYQVSYQQFDKLELDGVAASIGMVFSF